MRHRGLRRSRGRRSTSSSRACAAWSTAATTPPGVASLDADGALQVAKKAGRIENLDKELADAAPITGTTGMGHTRWATHGAPNDRNAHPHRAPTGGSPSSTTASSRTSPRCAPSSSADGVEFASETDTEIVAHLVAAHLARTAARSPTPCAPSAAGCRARSRWCCVDAEQPDVVVAARRNSPLVVGVGDGEMFLGSDVAAFIEFTREAVEPWARTRSSRSAATATSSPTSTAPSSRATPFHIDWDLAAAEKGGYEYFMLKEIAEQPTAVADTLLGHLVGGQIVLDEQRLDPQELRDVDKVFIVACGTAYHSGLIAKQAIEHWTRIPVEVEMASEFRYRDPVLDRQTLVVRDQPVRRDGRHPRGRPARRGAARQGAGHLQHQRRADPARVRRRALHPRRPGDRGRRDQDVPRPGRRGRARRPRPGPGPRHEVRRRDPPRVRRAVRDARRDRDGPGLARRRSARWPATSPSRGPCCSSAGTSATRSRSRVR